MKALKGFVICSILLCCAHISEAQYSYPQPDFRSTGFLTDRFPHVVKVNFLSPFVFTANVAYEQFITPKVSVQLGAFYTGITLEETDFYFFTFPRARYRSFAFTPEVRFYTGSPVRTRLGGFYLAPFLRYQHTDIHISPELQEVDEQEPAPTDTYEGSLSSIRVGGVAGYKLFVGEHVCLEAFLGPSLRVSQSLNANLNTYNAEDFMPFGLMLRSGFTIGYAF
ncbi:DUF3575 domain-containing protein [Nafulsella turpanensis]|uniref:DUF3575 domain-containing protein n=1 Tax=Nafulsella turpanensis TaxID=1265690 RepID=UPI000349BD74|nr:DUF3575 domain-containing protein [Nafulsella turpanensis]